MFRKCTRCTKIRCVSRVCVCAPGPVRKVAFFPASARDFSSRARVSRINSKKPAGTPWWWWWWFSLPLQTSGSNLFPAHFFLSCNVLLSPVQCGFICYFDYYLCKTFTYQPVHRKSAHRSALPWRVTHFIPKKMHVYMCLSSECVCVCVCVGSNARSNGSRETACKAFFRTVYLSPLLCHDGEGQTLWNCFHDPKFHTPHEWMVKGWWFFRLPVCDTGNIPLGGHFVGECQCFGVGHLTSLGKGCSENHLAREQQEQLCQHFWNKRTSLVSSECGILEALQATDYLRAFFYIFSRFIQ